MAKNAPLGLVGVILVAGSLVLLFFTILSGVTHTTPLDKTFFLRADTSGITGARPVTQWTFFYFCGAGNNNCGSAHAAPAFGMAWDGHAKNVPDSLFGSHGGHTTSNKFYLMWRFGWVFFLIALFFDVLAFFSGFLACLGRLGAALSGLIAFVALIFLTAAAALMTSTFVEARDAFHKADRSASIGRYAFGFVWGAWAALFLATVLFCIGLRGDRTSYSSSGGGGGFRRWGRRTRSTRSRTYDGRRVKDDYS